MPFVPRDIHVIHLLWICPRSGRYYQFHDGTMELWVFDVIFPTTWAVGQSSLADGNHDVTFLSPSSRATATRLASSPRNHVGFSVLQTEDTVIHQAAPISHGTCAYLLGPVLFALYNASSSVTRIVFNSSPILPRGCYLATGKHMCRATLCRLSPNL